MKKDRGASLLPTSYEVLRILLEEFNVYQQAAFSQREPRFFALELCGESGELANLEKKVWKGRTVEEAAFADEAADVLIALFNYANARAIDLADAVAEKMTEIDRRRLCDSGSPGGGGMGGGEKPGEGRKGR